MKMPLKQNLHKPPIICKCCKKTFINTSINTTLYCSSECKRAANLAHAKRRYFQKKECILKYGIEWRRRNGNYMKRYKKNHSRSIKEYNIKYYFGISPDLYKKLTKKCMINGCDFSLTVDLHHIDGDKQNNNPSNLVGLCPSHHQVIHRLGYRLSLKSERWILEP